jgi:hypothetical protein
VPKQQHNSDPNLDVKLFALDVKISTVEWRMDPQTKSNAIQREKRGRRVISPTESKLFEEKKPR